jgi:hypothetical protein
MLLALPINFIDDNIINYIYIKNLFVNVLILELDVLKNFKK